MCIRDRSMRANNSGDVSLSTKIRNYASELLQDRQIAFSFVIQPEAERALVSMKARKNILLILRELLNNVSKYSKANTVTVSYTHLDVYKRQCLPPTLERLWHGGADHSPVTGLEQR